MSVTIDVSEAVARSYERLITNSADDATYSPVLDISPTEVLEFKDSNFCINLNSFESKLLKSLPSERQESIRGNWKAAKYWRDGVKDGIKAFAFDLYKAIYGEFD